MDGWMDRWMGGWIDGSMDGWIDREIDRCIVHFKSHADTKFRAKKLRHCKIKKTPNRTYRSDIGTNNT
jgi:hypothetical protein